MHSKSNFKDGEKVLCYWNTYLYPAKILKKSQRRYYIHYVGWSKTWNEWVHENRLLEMNESNIQNQKKKNKLDKQLGTKITEVKASKSKERNTVAVNTTSSLAASTPNQKENIADKTKKRVRECDSRAELSKNKKRTTDLSIEMEVSFTTKIDVKIEIPEELKAWLVDDWNAINRQHKLHQMPAKNTVKDIIDTYIEYRKSNHSIDQDEEATVIDVMYGLVSYFNQMLQSNLLYKSEQKQYADILREHPNKKMFELCGPFHFLRLFVRIGSVLSYASLTQHDVDMLLLHVHDFLKWFAKHIDVYFGEKHSFKTISSK